MIKTTQRQTLAPSRLLALLAAATCGTAMAQTGAAGGIQTPVFKLSGGVSYGVSVRTSEPDSTLLHSNNANAVGLSSTNAGGRNQDDGNLNYRRGDVFSNVVTGFVDLNAKHGSFSGLLRVQGWHDFELDDGSVPFGHSLNGYQAGRPLSDSKARARGKFSNVLVSEAWLRGQFSPAGTPLTVTLGNQTIGWRGEGMVAGPMAVIDPVDLIAINRPGAFAEQRSIPIAALRATLKPRNDLTLDGFLQFGFRANQTPLCGTFFSVLDNAGEDGCTLSLLGGPSTVSDPQHVAAQRVILYPREAQRPDDNKQFGLRAQWSVSKTTEIGLAAARYHSRAGYTDVIKSSIPGNIPFAAGDPRNPAYQLDYPEGIRAFSVDFKHLLATTTLYGSLGYSPNRPLAYPGGEISAAFANPVTSASLFRAQERAVLPGEVFQAWDRHKVSQVQFGGIQPFKNVLGAATLNLRGELNGRFVHDMPAPTSRRYQRPDVFGMGPINGTCAVGASAVTCSNDGYVTPWAWGYQVQAVAMYPNVIEVVSLRPRISLAHNVKGYSFDGLLKEGRVVVQAGVDAIRGGTTLSLGLVHNAGESTYDNARDRNYFTAAVAVRF